MVTEGKQKGFTVIELMIVIAIIAIIGVMFLQQYLSITAQSKTSVSNKLTTMTLVLNGDHVPVNGSETGNLMVFMNTPPNPTPGATPPTNTKLSAGKLRGITFTVTPANAGTVAPNSTVTATTGLMSFTVFAAKNYEGPITITATDTTSAETIALSSTVE